MDIKMTREEFLTKFNEKYTGKYECRISEDKKEIKPSDKIPVICSKHGLFMETAYDLLEGFGCFKCFTEGWEEDK